MPAGVIDVRDCTPEGKAPSDFWGKQETLGAALNEELAGSKKYRVTVENGVIDVLPTGPIPPLLLTMVGPIDFSASTASFPEDQIWLAPEVLTAEKRLGIAMTLSGDGLTEGRRPLDLSLSRVSLFEGLNAIVRKRASEVWTYAESECGTRGDASFSFIGP